MPIRNFRELLEAMPTDRRRRLEKRFQKSLASMPLAQLTQLQLAEVVGVNQGEISKIEHRSDIFVSARPNTIDAMGGRLEIRAVFKDREVRITQFEELASWLGRKDWDCAICLRSPGHYVFRLTGRQNIAAVTALSESIGPRKRRGMRSFRQVQRVLHSLPMAKRRPIPPSVHVPLLVDNLHTCCICRVPSLPIEIHHIDGDAGNNASVNLAVVCRNCHGRLTSDEGLGRRYSPAEVTEFKRRWEIECVAATKSRAERKNLEVAVEARNAPRETRSEWLKPLYSNQALAQTAGAMAGVDIAGNFGPYMLDQLTRGLERVGKLSRSRPETVAEYEPNQFIFETVTATKVLIAHPTLKSTVPGLRELAVWIADPSAESLKLREQDGYDFAGTFLYLITPLYDDSQLDTFYSGCSALQVISNLVTGKPFLTTDWNEPLGRRSIIHPTDKLRSIGGIIVDRRPVETLYRPRYMSDEQTFAEGERVYRVHDLLAYPLYLQNSLEYLAKRI